MNSCGLLLSSLHGSGITTISRPGFDYDSNPIGVLGEFGGFGGFGSVSASRESSWRCYNSCFSLVGAPHGIVFPLK